MEHLLFARDPLEPNVCAYATAAAALTAKSAHDVGAAWTNGQDDDRALPRPAGAAREGEGPLPHPPGGRGRLRERAVDVAHGGGPRPRGHRRGAGRAGGGRVTR